MQNKKILFNFLLFIIISSYLIQNVSALSSHIHTTTGRVGNGNGFFSDEQLKFGIDENRNVYTVTNNTMLKIYEPISQPTGSTVYTLITASVSQTLRMGLVASDGHLYFVDSTGIKRMNSRDTTSGAYSNDTVSEANPNGRLTQIYSSTAIYLIREYNGYIYALDTNGVLFRFPLDGQYVVETYFSGITVGASSNSDWEIINDNNTGVTAILIANGQTGGHIKLYKSNSTNKDVLMYDHAKDSGTAAGVSMMVTENYILVSWDMASTTNTDILYRNYTAKTQLSGNISSSTRTQCFACMRVGGFSSVAVFADTTTAGDNTYDTLTWFEHGTVLSITNPFQLTYNIRSVNSLYDNYYNNSLFEIQYNIQIQTDSASTVADTYLWRIELVSPDGIKIADFPIISNMMKCLDILCIDGLSSTWGTSGTLKFSPPTTGWANGTYTVSLYEENITSSNKALLDDDSFNVFNQRGSLTGGIQQNPETVSSQQRMDIMLSSNYFWAFLVILIGIAVGAVLGVVGGIFGGASGIVFTFLMGLLPLWGLLLFAIIIFLALGIYVKNQQGGV